MQNSANLKKNSPKKDVQNCDLIWNKLEFWVDMYNKSIIQTIGTNIRVTVKELQVALVKCRVISLTYFFIAFSFNLDSLICWRSACGLWQFILSLKSMTFKQNIKSQSKQVQDGQWPWDQIQKPFTRSSWLFSKTTKVISGVVKSFPN